MEGGRAHHLGHVQANRRITRQLYCALPETGHAVLWEACIRVFQRGVVQPQFGEDRAAVDTTHFQRLDDTQGPTRRGSTFVHGIVLIRVMKSCGRQPGDEGY
ncbi:hypothetical protein D9M68_897280 [compost metagenome]